MSSETTLKAEPEELMKYVAKLNENSYDQAGEYASMDCFYNDSTDWTISESSTAFSNCSFSQTCSTTIVRPEEVVIVMVVMCIWVWSCVLFYVR